MKINLTKILAVTLLFALAAVSLPAQTNTDVPAILSAQQVLELEKQKLETQRAMTINKQECDKTEALNKQDAEKSQALNKQDAEKSLALNKQDAEKSVELNKQDAYKMMVHDLAWNSWVVAVLGGILMCGLFRQRRNKMMQETVRLMLEKGAPVTPEIITALKSKDRARSGVDPFGYLAWGLILTAVGSGLLVMHIQAGWIVILIGAAYLILWVVERLSSKNGQSK